MTGRSASTYSRKQFLHMCAGTAGVFGVNKGKRFAPASTPEKESIPFFIDLREFVGWIVAEFEPSVRVEKRAGHYSLRPGLETPDLYGVADMACILYTIGALHPSAEERVQWKSALESFQTFKNGWFIEESSNLSPQHNTAFALGAMQLLDLTPSKPITLGEEYIDIGTYLHSLNWKTNVYRGSHNGAGIGSIATLVPSLHSKKWFDEYFQTADNLFDPTNGLMGQAKPATGDTDQIGGTFHYAFLYEFFNRQMPYAEHRIDSVLGLQRPDGYWLLGNPLWMTLDAIYLMTRTLRYRQHRFKDVQQSLRRILANLERDVFSIQGRKASFYKGQGVHALTAAVSIAAECQQFLGIQEVATDWPLRLVLDRRPFI